MEFFVFWGDNYYPAGGASDCKGVFDSRARAIGHVRDELHREPGGIDWAHIACVCQGQLQIVWKWDRSEDKLFDDGAF